MQPGHLQSAAVRLCYSNVSHFTHSLQPKGISTCWLLLRERVSARGKWPGHLPDNQASIEKWDSVRGSWSFVRLFSRRRSAAAFSHGNTATHMEVIKATCGCSIVVCLTKCAGSQLESVSPADHFSYGIQTSEDGTLWDVILKQNVLNIVKTKHLDAFSLSSSAWWMTNRHFQSTRPRTNMLIQSGWALRREPSKPQSALIHHFLLYLLSSGFHSNCRTVIHNLWGQRGQQIWALTTLHDFSQHCSLPGVLRRTQSVCKDRRSNKTFIGSVTNYIMCLCPIRTSPQMQWLLQHRNTDD